MARFDFECRLRRGIGKRQVWVRILASSVETGNGRLWDGVALDVTAAKLAETERRRLQEELDRRHLSQATNRLASGISGDNWRSCGRRCAPMPNAFSRTLPPGTPSWRAAKAIHDIALRTQRLAEQLSLTRDDGRTEGAVDVVDRLATALATEELQVPEGVLIETHFDGREARVACGSEAVDHMVANLVSYIGETLGVEPGIVEIRTDVRTVEGGSHLCISVRDDRSVQAPRTLSRVLRMQTSRVAEGRGEELSLAIVRLVVDEARGWVQSRVTAHGGSTLEIFLPVASAPVGNVIRLERSSRWSKRDH